MITNQIKKKYWEEVCQYIRTQGKRAPLSMQYDVDMCCNGKRYILKLQMGRKCKVTVLQAIVISTNEKGDTSYTVTEEGVLLLALLQMMVYQRNETGCGLECGI